MARSNLFAWCFYLMSSWPNPTQFDAKSTKKLQHLKTTSTSPLLKIFFFAFLVFVCNVLECTIVRWKISRKFLANLENLHINVCGMKRLVFLDQISRFKTNCQTLSIECFILLYFLFVCVCIFYFVFVYIYICLHFLPTWWVIDGTQ